MAHTRHTTGVAFVPGFMQRGDAWSRVAGQVARRGWPVALVDFGEPTLDACVQAIVNAAGGGVAVGYSMGGRLTLQAAAREPGAFAALVLIGATPGVEDDALRRTRRAADESLADWIDQHPIEAVVDHWERQAVFDTQSDELVRAQRAGRLGHDPHALGALLRATGQGALTPVWDRLGDLSIPVLAIAGQDDDKYVAVAHRMAARLPRGRVAIVPNAGHAVQLEQPEATARLLVEFLDEHFGDRAVVDEDA